MFEKCNYQTYFIVSAAQWIALGALGQCVMGPNPISIIGGVGKGILSQLLLCSNDKTVLRPVSKNTLFQGFPQGMEPWVNLYIIDAVNYTIDPSEWKYARN